MIQTFNTGGKESLENIVRKGENAGNQHFVLFPQCFLLFLTQISNFESLLFLSSPNALILVKAKDLSFGKGLKLSWRRRQFWQHFLHFPLRFLSVSRSRPLFEQSFCCQQPHSKQTSLNFILWY